MIPFFDGHNDTLYRLNLADDAASMWASHPDRHIDRARSAEGGLQGGFFAIWTPPQHADGADFGRTFIKSETGYEAPLAEPESRDWAVNHANALLAISELLENDPGSGFRTVRDCSDWEPRPETMGAILHLEGAEPLRSDLSDLDDWYERGVRSIGIVWSRPNDFGTGVPFKYPTTPDIGPGLTEAGKSLVRACNERRILIDLAHLNERGFWDVAELTNAPLVVTHACVNAISPTARNVTDAQIDAIGQSGGVLGINFAAADLRHDGQRDVDAPAALIIEHTLYAIERIGVEHVAFGSDFDGARVPSQLDGARGLQEIATALADAGLSSAEVECVTWRNWQRVVCDTWTA